MTPFEKNENIFIRFIKFQKEKFLLVQETKKKHKQMFMEFKRESFIKTQRTLECLLEKHLKNLSNYESQSNIAMEMFHEDVNDFKELCNNELKKVKRIKFRDVLFYERYY